MFYFPLNVISGFRNYLLDPKQTGLCLKIYIQQGVLTTLSLSHINTCQRFLSQNCEIFSLSWPGFQKTFQQLPMIFWGLPNVAENVRRCSYNLLGTCQKLAGGKGGGGWKQRVGHNFLRLRKGRGHEKSTVKRGRVMQIYAHDHVEVHPQKKKEVLYLIKKRKKKNNGTLWI